MTNGRVPSFWQRGVLGLVLAVLVPTLAAQPPASRLLQSAERVDVLTPLASTSATPSDAPSLIDSSRRARRTPAGPRLMRVELVSARPARLVGVAVLTPVYVLAPLVLERVYVLERASAHSSEARGASREGASGKCLVARHIRHVSYRAGWVIDLKVFDPQGLIAATIKLGPFVSTDGKSFVADPTEKTVYKTPDGHEVTVPQGAFAEHTLVSVTNLDASSLNVAMTAGLAVGAYVKVDFAGTAKESLRVKVPLSVAAPVGRMVFVGEPVELTWGKRLKLLELGKVVDGGAQGPLASTHPSDQPALRAGTSGRTAQATRALPPNVIASALLELRVRADAAFCVSNLLDLQAGVGFIDPGQVGAQLSVFYNALADTFVYVPKPTDWSGHYILPMDPSVAFEIVQRDPATGWVTARQQYPAQPGTGLIELPPAPSGPAVAPRLLSASPFFLSRLSARSVTSDECDGLRLDLRACHTLSGNLLLADSSAPLGEGAYVLLYNITTSTPATANPVGPVDQSGQWPSPAAPPSGGYGYRIQVPTSVGDDVLAVVTPGDLDPDDGFFDFVFDQTLAPLATGAQPAKLFDCGAVTTPQLVPLSCTLLVTVEAEVSGSRLAFVPKGPLARGHRYRLELVPTQIHPPGTPTATYQGPTDFFFQTADAPDEPVGSGESNALGDTGLAWDMVKVGNLIFAASYTGRIVALDASVPLSTIPGSKLTAKAHALLEQPAGLIRNLVHDGHGRVIYSHELGGTWSLKAFRKEDALSPGACSPGAPAWAQACFQPAVGGVKVAQALSGGTPLTATEFLLQGSKLPMGTPVKIELQVRDEVDPTYSVEDFYAAYTPGGGAPPPAGPDGFHVFGVTLDACKRPPEPRGNPCNGDTAADKIQRITVDNLTLGQSWSFDVPTPVPPATCTGGVGAGKYVPGIRARRGDRLRVRYNLTTHAYLAVVGSGIEVVDVNRFYETPRPAGLGFLGGAGQCGRLLAVQQGQTAGFSDCPAGSGPLNYQGIANVTSVSPLGATESSPAPEVHAYAPMLHFGLVWAGTGPLGAGYELDFGGAMCLRDVAPPLRAWPRESALYPDATWYQTVQGSTGSVKKEGDLLFVTLGGVGVQVFDVSYRSSPIPVGRLLPKGRNYSKLYVDRVRGRLFVGGLDATGKSVIDVYDVSRVWGTPLASGEDPRVLLTINASWDTRSLAFDEGTGLLYGWTNGNDPGPRLYPVDEPQVVFAARLRAPQGAGTSTPTSTYQPTNVLVPLGAPSRATVDEELDPASKKLDEENLPAAFKVRVSLPPGLGATLQMKVQALRSLPERRLLGRGSVGVHAGMPGGPGWPDTQATLTLVRLTDPTGTNGPLSEAGSLYESKETVLLLRDPRARSGYTLQSVPGEASEDRQCRRCARPAHLPAAATGTAQDPLVELLAAGPYVRAYLFAADPTKPGYSETQNALALFADLGESWRAPAGFAEVSAWATEVPSVAQVSLTEPALSPAIVPFEAGASVSLVTGEAIYETVDHATKGRSIGFAFDRTYRSHVLGYGPLGAAGWNSSLFASLRSFPLYGIDPATQKYAAVSHLAEYHDGQGRVFRFVLESSNPASPCPSGWEEDNATPWCAPRGLYLRLQKVSGGWRLITPSMEVLAFDDEGRLREIRDRHRQNAAAHEQGSTLVLSYDHAGQLQRLEDEMGRRYAFEYEEDPASGDFGLLKRLTDLGDGTAAARRTVAFHFDAGVTRMRRLESVELPTVNLRLAGGIRPAPPATPGKLPVTPAITYTYSPTGFTGQSPLTGGDFSALRLSGMKLPGGQEDRVGFTYEGSTGRATEVKVPSPILGTPLVYRIQGPSTAQAATQVDVIDVAGLRTSYELELAFPKLGHVKTITQRSLPVASFSGTSVSAPTQDATTLFEREDDGRVTKTTYPDGSEETATYPTSGDRLAFTNVLSASELAAGAPAGTASYAQATKAFLYTGENLLTRIANDGLGRSLDVPVANVPVPGLSGSGSASAGTSDGLSGTVDYDAYGRPDQQVVGAAVAQTVSMKYAADLRGKPDAGFLTKVESGPLATDLEVDARGNVTATQDSAGTRDEVVYDEWDRPVEATLGMSVVPDVKAVDAQLVRGYDQAGRLAFTEESQKDALGGIRTIKTSYRYNEREQLIEVIQTGVADETPTGTANTSATTLYAYDTTTGLLKTVTSPDGILTENVYDTAGRLVEQTRGAVAGSGTRRMLYDSLSRLVYTSDGDAPASLGEWKGYYDAWGRLYKEELPTGATVERTFDQAGNLTEEKVTDGTQLLAHTKDIQTKSWGAVTQAKEVQDVASSQELVVTNAYDDAGRAVLKASGGRIDARIEYEPITGRVKEAGDETGSVKPSYGASGALPWPETVTTFTSPSGSCGAAPSPASSIENTVTTARHDAFGRTVEEKTNDGAATITDYDEMGSPVRVATGGGLSLSETKYAYDSQGSLIRAERPASRGTTLYGFDPDGRLRFRSEQGLAGGYQHEFEYDLAGRLIKAKRPDGGQTLYTYYPDDQLQTATRSDGIVITYEYDKANRKIKETPSTTNGLAMLDGGKAYSYDPLSRILAIQRLASPNAPIPQGPAVTMSGHDLAGRPTLETVGTRAPIARAYDTLSRVTGLTLPTGIGGGLSYTRTYESCTNRLLAIQSGLPAIGARYAWHGDKPLGVTTSGPWKTAHRYGWVQGDPTANALGAAWPGNPQPPAVFPRFQLGTLTIGTAGTSNPQTEARHALGSSQAPGSYPWGQLAYGYRGGDNARLGRKAVLFPTIGPKASDVLTNPMASIVKGQGWAWGTNSTRRLTEAWAGDGSLEGLSDPLAYASAKERFVYGYGSRDEVTREERQITANTADLTLGVNGRPQSLSLNNATPAPILYEPSGQRNEGRRMEDERFTYTWWWFGKLASVTFKTGPNQGHEVRYVWDGLGRLYAREHLGPPPGTAQDRLLERREYLWDGNALAGEASYDPSGSLVFRKSYVPGARGLDDQPQMRVEEFASGTLTRDVLYSILRDEQGTVLGLVEETGAPVSPSSPPPLRLRFLYTPYGEVHAELGPELRKARFEQGATSVTPPGGSQQAQTPTAPNLGGAIKLTFGTALDASSYTGLVLEKATNSVFTPLPPQDLVIGSAPSGDEADVFLMPRSGFELGATYRVRFTSALKDAWGRPAFGLPALDMDMPPAPPPGSSTAITFSWERPPSGPYPILYDTQTALQASSAVLAGGMPFLFQGLYTDDLTGLTFARNRWYDAETMAFISEDPEADADSPSLYAFVAGRPHEATDPMGTVFGVDNLIGGAASVAIGWGISKLTGSEYSAADAAVDFALGFATSGLSSISKIKHLGKVGRAVTRAAAEMALDVGSEVVRKELKGEDYKVSDLAVGAVKNFAMGEAASYVGRKAGNFLRGAGDEAADAARHHNEPPTAAKEAGPEGFVCPLGRRGSFAPGTSVLTASGLKPIEDLRVGERVLTASTLEREGLTEVDDTWRLVRYRLVIPGDEVEVDYLVPAHQAEEYRPGDRIRLDMEEPKVSGEAEVLAIGKAPSVEKGPGRIVLSTIRHLFAGPLLIAVKGEEKPVEVTDAHPLYLEKKGWVEAKGVEAGDRILTSKGAWLEVERVARSEKRLRVFNLTVESEHSYYVGGAHLLVHNANCPVSAMDVGDYGVLEKGAVSGDGLAHHEIPSNAATRKAYEIKTGSELSRSERRSFQKGNTAVELPDDLHALQPTTGGNNTQAQILQDALDLGRAQRRDLRALIRTALQRPYSRTFVARIVRQIRSMNRAKGIK